MARWPEYQLTFTIAVKARDADEAAAKGKAKMPREAILAGVSLDDMAGPQIPVISDALKWFMSSEIDNNDADPDGNGTDLDTVLDSLVQTPDDVLLEICHAAPDADAEALTRSLVAEVEALMSQYGGSFCVGVLLDRVEPPPVLRR
jgi:hypothetical protein